MIGLSNAEEFALLVLSGELDLADASNLQDAFASLDLERVFIVSLEQLTFLDSSVLGALIRAHRQHEGNIVLVVPRGAHVARIFAVAGLATHFQFTESLTEAIACARRLRGDEDAAHLDNTFLEPRTQR